jgi:DNA-binding SARP family transcriptional activator/Tfp pilus assembly protein PilF
MDSMLQLRAFGSIDLRSATGEQLRAVLAQPKRLALLAYLALARPRGPQRRDQVVALFWPEQDAEHARNALSQAVFFLRRFVGPDTLVSRNGDELELVRDALWCDALAFEQAIGAGDHARAVELYRGELLPGLHIPGGANELDRWLDVERTRYARTYAEALESLASACEAVGDDRGAVVWWRQLAAHDPYSSRATLRLMQAVAASGDPAAAVRCARDHLTLLGTELGIRPDPEVTALAERLSAGVAIVRPRDGGVAAAAHDGTQNAAMVAPSPPTLPPPRSREILRLLAIGGTAIGLVSVALILTSSTMARPTHPDRITSGLYARGRDALLTRTPMALRQAIDFFQQAVVHDSTFAAGHAGIAEAYGLASDLGYLPQAAANESVLVHVGRALSSDNTLAQAHVVLAGSLSEHGDFVAAEAAFRRAIELDSANAVAHHWYAMLLATLGRGDEAIAENALAASYDPLSSSVRNAGREIRAYFGHSERVDSGTVVDPTNPWARATAAVRDARSGRCAEANRRMERARQDVPQNLRMSLFDWSVAFYCGDSVRAREVLRAAEALPEAHVHGYYIAMAFRRLGEIDSTFAWLDSTGWNVQQRFNFRTNRDLDSLRSDPRFRHVLQRMGVLTASNAGPSR